MAQGNRSHDLVPPHVVSTAIMGVGATKRLSAVKWGIVGRIVWAWVLTLPVTAILAVVIHRVLAPLFGGS